MPDTELKRGIVAYVGITQLWMPSENFPQSLSSFSEIIAGRSRSTARERNT